MGDRKTLYERGLRKKVELAEELLKKTKALDEAVEQGNSVEVQTLLAERQDLMERINRVDAEMLLPGKAPFLSKPPIPSRRTEGEEDGLWKAFRNALLQAAELDRVITEKVIAEQKRVQEELRTLRKAARSFGAYRDRGTEGRRFVDVTG